MGPLPCGDCHKREIILEARFQARIAQISALFPEPSRFYSFTEAAENAVNITRFVRGADKVTFIGYGEFSVSRLRAFRETHPWLIHGCGVKLHHVVCRHRTRS